MSPLAAWFPELPSAAPAPIRRVGIVGAGVMGTGIAQLLSTRGFPVVLRDNDPAMLARGNAVIASLFAQTVARGKLDVAAAQEAQGRIQPTTGWHGFKDLDLVIEAIVEDVAAKRALFSELAAVVPPGAILASNTSALPIEEIAGHVRNPERTIGLHFFNPAPRMPLIEMVLAPATSAATAARALSFVESIGKTPVVCRSSPGFLVTRVLFFYLNEAVKLWETAASGPDIDAAMRAFGWPMGPLRLIDEIGIDVTGFIFGEMAHYYPDRFKPATACRRLLAAGMKGRKNGAGTGFYTYGGKEPTSNEAGARQATETSSPPGMPAEQITKALMTVMAGEARLTLRDGVVKTPGEIDLAMIAGTGFPASRGGLLDYIA